MMAEQSELLMEVAGETLEQLAFIFSFPDDMDPEAIWEAETTGCHITFSGPNNGELLMVISSSAMPELAANMLGLDDDEPPLPDQQNDALKESLNVICGNLLPRIGGEEAVFDIQAPKIMNVDATRAMLGEFKTDPDGFASAQLSLDEGDCHLFMRMNNAA
ncbi:MAG: chemotaxis protein CheX [Desulfobacterales bacterium]|jgi:chemotaxis protein CheY-P-specific phosphatase CheC